MSASYKPKEGVKMPDSEAKKKWMAENTTIIKAKLNHNTDKDILKFIEKTPNVAGLIKSALREYMKNHPEE